MPVAAGELPSCLEWMGRIVGDLLEQEPKFVVWLCPWQGAIEKEGKTFEEFNEYKAIKTHICAIVQMPEFLPAATHGRDFAEMLDARLTFAEALEVRDFPDEDGNLVPRSVRGHHIATMQRLKKAKERVYRALERTGVFE